MLRKFASVLILATALGTVACGASTAAARKQLVAPAAPATAFGSALRVLADFGYSITSAEKDAGLIRAERRASGGVTEGLTGAAYYWGLTVMMSPEGTGTRFTLQPENIEEKAGRRRTAGMRITGKQQAQVDSIAARLSMAKP